MRVSPPMRPRRVQPRLFPVEHLLRGHGHARYIAGELIEDVTAAIFGGRRHIDSGAYDYCPDVSIGDLYLECKAMGTSGQSMVYTGRLEKDYEFTRRRKLIYCIWHHTAKPNLYETVEDVEAAILANLQWCAWIPFAEIYAYCAARVPEPLNSQYGKHSNPGVYGSGYRLPKSFIKPWICLEVAHADLQIESNGAASI